MSATYKLIDKTDYSDTFSELDAFALEVLVGLSDSKKYLPAKYLYDDIGSALFIDITNLDEYYPTNCEREILSKRSNEIIAQFGESEFNLVELGAGYGRKTRILIDHLLEQKRSFQYVPIDISESAMAASINVLNNDFPKLETNGLVSDYFAGLKWLNNRYNRKNVVLFLGSSIGNFTHAEARYFLKNVWNCLNHNDQMFIGFDLKKDIEVLLCAYNDSKGITAKFNLNLLDRINRELGGEFKLDNFRHFGTYDVFSGAMESYLVSLVEQQVFVKEIGRSFQFKPWEPIHTEYSYKYLISDIENLAAETGFVIEKNLFDSKRWFVDSIWRVDKPQSVT